jgi:hypothetical protein
MTTTAITSVEFRVNFPEFASAAQYPDDVVTFWIAAADLMLSVSRWGLVRDMGVQLYAAHNLSLERAAMNAAANGGVPGAASGAVSQKTVGPASISYDSPSAAAKDAGDFNTTIYGQRLWRMIQIFGSGPIQIGIGSAPVGIGGAFFNGGAWPGPAPWPLPSGTGFSS